MANVSAEQVSLQGDKYLGTPYSKMDCQAFVEKCMKDAGMDKNLAGSNAWYRECRKNGWVGTPEQCKSTFGSIPKGAFLFILKHDGSETQRGYKDGLGNASHIGLYTGRGKGAIHSSSSRGCVAESAFKGKTIPNGGWNTVGLWDKLDYGDKINRKLRGDDDMGILHDLFGTPQQQPTTATDLQPTTQTDLNPQPIGTTRIVTAKSGGTVNVREKPGGAKRTQLPIGTKVEAIGGATDESGVEWTHIRYTVEGWMMAKFLRGGE